MGKKKSVFSISRGPRVWSLNSDVEQWLHGADTKKTWFSFVNGFWGKSFSRPLCPGKFFLTIDHCKYLKSFILRRKTDIDFLRHGGRMKKRAFSNSFTEYVKDKTIVEQTKSLPFNGSQCKDFLLCTMHPLLAKAQRSVDFYLNFLAIFFWLLAYLCGVNRYSVVTPSLQLGHIPIERDQSWKGSLVCSPWKVRQGRQLWGRGSLGTEGRSRGGGWTQLWGWQSACERERCQIQKKRKGQPSESPRRVYPRMWLTLSVSALDIPEADIEGVEKRWQGPAVHELFTDARHVFICCGFQGHHLLFRVGCWRELSPYKGTTHSKN